MTQKKFCQSCNQKHNCQEIFQQMGGNKGPSIAFKAAIAFLLPMIAFVVILAIAEANFANVVNNKPLQTAITVLLALTVTFILILIIKAIDK